MVHPVAPRGAPCSVTYLIPAEPYFIVALKNNDDMETYKRDWGRNNKENVWKILGKNIVIHTITTPWCTLWWTTLQSPIIQALS